MNDFNSALASVPIIGIIRGIGKDHILDTVNAACDGGLKCIEITLNTPNALELIAMVARRNYQGTFIGAGTVLSGVSCEQAIGAGAEFIVAPNMSMEVVSACKRKSVPFFPGALTPSEVFTAWQSGACMVKVFPVSAMGGPSYIKELRGPFESAPLLACGGVTAENLRDYFAAGVSGIAIGGKVFNNEWIRSGAFAKVRDQVHDYVMAVGKVHKQ